MHADFFRAREASVEDCSQQRFIIWAAVKRNKSVRIPASAQLSCPLIRCSKQFEDHESMLRHLVKCEHLPTGEYVCFECMKVENFNTGKCHCCQGQRTKRRRIINMARNFFSSIGHKSRKDEPCSVGQDYHAMPPPYDSLPIPDQPQLERQEQPHIELNGREIVELDSRPMMPTAQLDSVNYEPQATSDALSTNTFDTAPNPASASARTPLTPCGRLSNQQSVPFTPPPSQMRPGNGNTRPSLAINTHLDRYRNVPRPKFLSPSSSLRSSKSSQGVSPVTPWSSSSGSSGNWTLTSSIDTTLTSPITPSSPIGYPTAPQVENAFINPKDTEICPESGCTLDPLPELPGDDPYTMQSLPRGLSDPPLFSFDPKDNYSWMSSVNTNLSLGTSINVVFSDASHNPAAGPPTVPNPYPTSRALVESAWSALREHMASSLVKVTQIPENPLVRQLQSESIMGVFRRGLSSLRQLLVGKTPRDPFDYICFIHTIYAFSLVIHEHDLATRCSRLFRQALTYQGFPNPTSLRNYSEFVRTIWQSDSPGQSQEQSNLSSSSKGKEPEFHASSRGVSGDDALIIVAQNFLDGKLRLYLVSSRNLSC